MGKRLSTKMLSIAVVFALIIGIVPAIFPNHVSAAGATYYIDSVSGNDNNDGTGMSTAWRTLTKVNTATFAAGDRILFKAGCTWSGAQLWPKGSGTSGSAIVIDMYGTGAKPIFAGNGAVNDVVKLYNQQYWEINNLEITNNATTDAMRNGIAIEAKDAGTLNHIYLKNLYVHDVVGYQTTTKSTSGIHFQIFGNAAPTNWNDILIDGCTVNDVTNYGIWLHSSWYNREGIGELWKGQTELASGEYGNYYASTNLTIQNCTLNRIGNGGITPLVFNGVTVQNNYVNEASNRATGNVAIWWAMTDNLTAQYNEVCNTYLKNWDGQAFDADFSSKNSTIQYNYSHSNQGGFVLVMSFKDCVTTNTVIRNNISQNDASGILRFNFQKINDTKFYNNTVYIGPGVNPYITKIYGGSPTNVTLCNNIFYSLGDQGFDTNSTFAVDHNCYYGGGTVYTGDVNRITSDPNLISPGSGGTGMNTVDGYKLQAGSPCINAGKAVLDAGTGDFWGNAIYYNAADMGAFENPSGTINPPPVITVTSTFTTGAVNLNNLVDGYDAITWASNTAPVLPGYITFDYGTNQVISKITLDTWYGVGQGITNLDVEYYNGTSWVAAATNQSITWSLNTSEVESRDISFGAIYTSKIRIKVNSANRQWGNIGLNEFRIGRSAETNYAPLAAASTTFGTGNGKSISTINNNVITDGWASTVSETFPKYITLDLGAISVTTGKMTLITHYGVGQGITNVDVEYYNGSTWVTAAANIGITWNTNLDSEEYRDITFPAVTATKIRLKVNSANRQWRNIALNELQLWGN